METLKAYEVIYKISPRRKLSAVRFADNLQDATDSAKRVLEVEQGYKVVSVIETTDPRNK